MASCAVGSKSVERPVAEIGRDVVAVAAAGLPLLLLPIPTPILIPGYRYRVGAPVFIVPARYGALLYCDNAAYELRG